MKKIPSEDQKETTVIKTFSTKVESTEEATVYANDLDVFVTMKLMEGSPPLLSLGFIKGRNGLFQRKKRRDYSSSLRKDG